MRLGGLQKMTLLDFPGRVACTVFTLGCNFRCPFCHNTPLVVVGGGAAAAASETGPGSEQQLAVSAAMRGATAEYPLEDFFRFLQKRQGLLDGVAITGGEPLLHPDAADFIRRIRSLGYAVKLDTNGAFPERLAAIIDEGLVDYVAVDIKNSPEKYALTAGLGAGSPESTNVGTSPACPRTSTARPYAQNNGEPQQGERIATPLCGPARNDGKPALLAKVDETVRLLLEGRVDYEFRTTLVDELHEPADFARIGQWIQGAPRYFIQANQCGKTTSGLRKRASICCWSLPVNST